MRTRVKICGITRPEDGLAAAQYGADAIGLVFYKKSPRYVTPEQAQAIIDCLPAYVTVVGLFVNHLPQQVEDISQHLGLDLLQFHGNESVADCEISGQAYMKAVPVKNDLSLPAAIKEYHSARAVLVDTYQADQFGGSGKSFNWNLLPKDNLTQIVLAGGLSPLNIEQAIFEVHPWAVDVSSGVESAPGIKDGLLIKKFMKGVSNADAKRQ